MKILVTGAKGFVGKNLSWAGRYVVLNKNLGMPGNMTSLWKATKLSSARTLTSESSYFPLEMPFWSKLAHTIKYGELALTGKRP